jgi:murein DD-endopeptidase MepM/ murein hydrolase activator NlpD
VQSAAMDAPVPGRRVAAGEQAMCAAVGLKRACAPGRAVALAIALGVTGCSGDVGSFEHDRFARAPASKRWTTGPSAFATPHLRPPGDIPGLASARTPVAGANPVARVAGPAQRPSRVSPARTAVRAAKTKAASVPKGRAESRRGTLTADDRRPPVRRIASGSVDRRGDTGASFGWPAQGAIIARFGRQADGQENSGIAIAVPEHTPIKSAEDGVVIYAGRLKSFGNLALVRHANNYVTAYAHAKEFAVKRGDRVRRGDVIGRSGQTGNAPTPRLHFEIRKDSVPVKSGGCSRCK